MFSWVHEKQRIQFSNSIELYNRPLPSSKNPHFQNEAKCTAFLGKWVLFAWEWRIISISKAEHLTSFWYRGPGELGNGLFHVKEVVHPSFSKPWFRKVCWTILWLKWVMPYSSRQTLVHNMSLLCTLGSYKLSQAKCFTQLLYYNSINYLYVQWYLAVICG